MDRISRLSEAVYVGLSRKIGTPTIVTKRREIVDIAEIIERPAQESIGGRQIISGSHREGFGSVASHIDFMCWLNDHHVICDLVQAIHFNEEKCTLILMEYSNICPRFAMLQLLTPSHIVYFRRSCIRINGGLYISSALFKENTLFMVGQDCTQHGPCASGKFTITDFDYDCAFCFASKFWPSIATSFTLRCRSKGWPPNHVLSDIINSGCHVVPIGLKGSPQEDSEWRISFSIAEQKLVYCMNHTQFMCYGLLKLFLKEVLRVEDSNGQPLLCSYFMKTVLFWVIQNNLLGDWNPSSLLSGFWLFFKFLLSRVYHGQLENFFVTENNIFISKIFGHSRQILLERLFAFYNQGIACLLHCKTIRNYLTLALCTRQYLVKTTESDITPKFHIDRVLFIEIDRVDTLGTFSLDVVLQCAIRHLQDLHISSWQRAALEKIISSLLRRTVCYLSRISQNMNNKNALGIVYACLNLLKISVKMGFISDRIYLGLFFYSLGKNKEATKYLRKIKTVIDQPYIMYAHMVDGERYLEKVEEMTVNEKMRRAVARNIRLDTLRLKELDLEHSVSTAPLIRVPPNVMTLMLLVLCYRGNPDKQHEALLDLYNLLHHGEGRYTTKTTRDISWQILGICQQLCGDNWGALLSYQNSLRQIPFHGIREATYYRMLVCLFNLFD